MDTANLIIIPVSLSMSVLGLILNTQGYYTAGFTLLIVSIVMNALNVLNRILKK